MSIDDINKEEWDKVSNIKPDMVNKPQHYQGIVECIELIRDRVGSKGYAAYLESNIWKYLYRHKDKEENIHKAALPEGRRVKKKFKKRMQSLSFLKRKLTILHLSQKMLFKKTLTPQSQAMKRSSLRLK